MKVYLFWHSYPNNVPPIVDLCIRMWKDLHPNWDVRVIDGAECDVLLSGDFSQEVLRTINITQKSDLLRLKLLSNTGGIWSDATGLPLQNLEKWISTYKNSEFSTPETPHPQRRISQWFICAKSESFIVSSLYETVKSYWMTSKLRLPSEMDFLPIVDANFREYISDHAAHVLRIYPYFFLNYLFVDKLGKDSAFAEAFRKAPVINYDGKGGFSSIWRTYRDALNEKDTNRKSELMASALSKISKNPTPLVKMSWKHEAHDLPISDIERVIRKRAAAALSK